MFQVEPSSGENEQSVGKLVGLLKQVAGAQSLCKLQNARTASTKTAGLAC